MGMFEVAKGEDGKWKTNLLAQLKQDILSLRDDSWLKGIGNLLLIEKLRRFEPALLTDAGLSTEQIDLLAPFIASFIDYKLPPGYAVDADAKNPLVEKVPNTLGSHVGETVPAEIVCVDLLALHALAEKCAALVDASHTELPLAYQLKAE